MVGAYGECSLWTSGVPSFAIPVVRLCVVLRFLYNALRIKIEEVHAVVSFGLLKESPCFTCLLFVPLLGCWYSSPRFCSLALAVATRAISMTPACTLRLLWGSATILAIASGDQGEKLELWKCFPSSLLLLFPLFVCSWVLLSLAIYIVLVPVLFSVGRNQLCRRSYAKAIRPKEISAFALKIRFPSFKCHRADPVWTNWSSDWHYRAIYVLKWSLLSFCKCPF